MVEPVATPSSTRMTIAPEVGERPAGPAGPLAPLHLEPFLIVRSSSNVRRLIPASRTMSGFTTHAARGHGAHGESSWPGTRSAHDEDVERA
jgi:hypothetical protein